MGLVLKELLQKTVQFFEQKGVPEARLSAEWLIAEALRCKRLDLYLRYVEMIPEPILEKLRPWVLRRAKREPWQYIVGHTAFLDLDLIVNPSVLIPRPETEELVANLVEFTEKPPSSILDLGTGTGAIALALAKAYPSADVMAADKSLEALAVAKNNAEKNDLKESVEWIASDWFSNVTGTFDWIVANPPYLTDAEHKEALAEVREYEPISALVASDDGMADLKIIIKAAFGHLSPGGLLALETGIAHGSFLQKFALEAGYKNVVVRRDLAQRTRFLWAYKPT